MEDLEDETDEAVYEKKYAKPEPTATEPLESKGITLRTLETQVADKLINQIILDHGNIDPGTMAAALAVRGFVTRLMDTLYEYADAFQASSITIQLLVKALEGKAILHLSPLMHLSAAFVALSVEELRTTGHLMALDISNSKIKDVDLLSILSVCPTLGALYLLNTQNLSVYAIKKAISDTNAMVDEVYHADAMEESLKARSQEPQPPPAPGTPLRLKLTFRASPQTFPGSAQPVV